MRHIDIRIDLNPLFPAEDREKERLSARIREMQNNRARFTTSRSNDYISSVVIWSGEGRERRERKLNLSIPQGRFLFHLPFPTAEPLSIGEIVAEAGLDDTNIPEILDIVNVLTDFGVIESCAPFT